MGALVKDRKTTLWVFAAPPLGGSFSISVGILPLLSAITKIPLFAFCLASPLRSLLLLVLTEVENKEWITLVGFCVCLSE